MTVIAWPAGLNYRAISPELSGMTFGGGRSLSGIEQRTLRHPGFWRLRIEGVVVNTAARARAWRTLIARLRAGDAVEVPIADPYRPLGARLAGALASSAAAAAGATTITATIAGHDVDPGHYFSTGGRLHLVTEVTAGTGDGLYNQLVTDSPWDDRIPWVDAASATAVASLRFLPPLRAALAAGTELRFARPTLICRLAEPDGGELTLDLLRRGVASLDLVENF